MWTWLMGTSEPLNQLAGALQSVATVVALLVGGIWTFRIFIKNRLNRPCANVTHVVTTKLLSGHGMLVHVGVQVKNDSAVLMRLATGEIRLVPVLPLDDATASALASAAELVRDRSSEPEVQWPSVRSYKIDWSDCPREIEPHESDTFHFDFVTKSDLVFFEVYSYLQNVTKSKRDIGWSTTTLHEAEEQET
jgi:hypothetical protein